MAASLVNRAAGKVKALVSMTALVIPGSPDVRRQPQSEGRLPARACLATPFTD
jgi:hypothetical protein